MKKTWLGVGLLVAMSPAAALDVPGYENAKKVDAEGLGAYMSGVGSGIMAANSRAKPGLYCQPEGLPLNAKNYISIVDDQIAHIRQEYAGPEAGEILEKAPVSLILMWGLERTFPCDQ